MRVGKVPQVVSITRVFSQGMIRLSKAVRRHLRLDGLGELRLAMDDEVLLSAQGSAGTALPLKAGIQVRLPAESLTRLGLSAKSLVCLVQRPGSVAVKKFELVQKEGEVGRIYDVETMFKVTRVDETNPMPDQALPRLRDKNRGFGLTYDVRSFLGGRRTVEAWKVRKTIGIAEPSDERLRKELIQERLGKQLEDGSWEEKTTVTARCLSELAELGMTREDPEVQKAAEWLLRRPQSPYNPGMFFAYDELVEEQKEVREGRLNVRFNQRRAREVSLVREGDSLVRWACGPRITWTTALVLEALLRLGYEENERVQAALRTLSMVRWCDNAQQYGRQRRKTYSIEEIEQMTADSTKRFRYGGVQGTETLEKADMSHMPFNMCRIGHITRGETHEYPLSMPDVGGGCPTMMMRALSKVKDEKLRKLAEAQLWQVAACQHAQNRYYEGKYSARFFRCPQAMYLRIFASYDHPVSKVAIMKMIPWIISSQNEDGSWGDQKTKDASTLAVITALKNVGLL